MMHIMKTRGIDEQHRQSFLDNRNLISRMQIEIENNKKCHPNGICLTPHYQFLVAQCQYWPESNKGLQRVHCKSCKRRRVVKGVVRAMECKQLRAV